VDLDAARGFVLDIDGTLVHRSGTTIHLQPGAAEVLARIRASGRRFVLFTNGSHVSPATLAAELSDAGLEVGEDDVLTPLCSLRTYVSRRRLTGCVMVIGTAPAREYVQRSGVPVDQGEGLVKGAVFVAGPDAIDFPTLERAARSVLAGARLLTASYVPAYAGADGPIFSRGAMTTAAIAKATGVRPVIVGKPSRAAVDTFSDRLGAPPADLVVIGDDVAMDIPLGHLGGSHTIFVRSGISGDVDLGQIPAGRRPHETVTGVAELLDRL
jgi:HAD superfamily hydrolase (TIGR01450 family)